MKKYRSSSNLDVFDICTCTKVCIWKLYTYKIAMISIVNKWKDAEFKQSWNIFNSYRIGVL